MLVMTLYLASVQVRASRCSRVSYLWHIRRFTGFSRHPGDHTKSCHTYARSVVCLVFSWFSTYIPVSLRHRRPMLRRSLARTLQRDPRTAVGVAQRAHHLANTQFPEMFLRLGCLVRCQLSGARSTYITTLLITVTPILAMQ